MIINVVAVYMVEPPLVDEIGMRPVLNARMLLTGVAVGMVIRGHPRHQFLAFRMGGANLQRVLIKMPGMRVMQVAIMEKIDMAAVLDRLMATSLAVGMGIVTRMDHFMRQCRGSEKREREGSKKEGSVHINAFHIE
jgi:hypothetical protein